MWLGWEAVFYIFGVIGLIWSIFFCLLVKTNPRQSTWISKQELEYITRDQVKEQPKKTPYSKFFKSPAVWAIAVAQVSYNFGWFILLGWLPTYFKSLGVPFNEVGWYKMVNFFFFF
jgi:sugar phosphate permease